MLQRLIHWLAHTAASQVIQKVFWIIPTVQVVHILAISVVMASMAMFDLRLLGLAGRRHRIASLSQRFMPWLSGALLTLLLSGSVLIVGEPQRSLDNAVFKTKMGMLLTAVLLTWSFHRLLRRDLASGAEDLKPEHAGAAKLIGGVSLLLWVGIVAAGRLIAYAG